MMKNCFVLVCLLFLAACSTLGFKADGQANKAKLVYSMQNGLLGSSASQLSQADLTQALLAEYMALEQLEAGQTVKWQSKTSNSNGTVKPGQPYKVGSQNCRQYTHNFTINNIPKIARGSACRNEDGSWSPLI